MAEPSIWQQTFESMVATIEGEADAFANILDTIVGFDVVSQCGTAIDVFKAAGVALTTLFFCMEVFTYCAQIDFNGGIEGALRIAMKMIVAALIVQNTDKVVGAVSEVFKNASLSSYHESFQGIADAFAASATTGVIDGIMGVLGPGVIALGSLVAVVGGIQTGVAFKDDNPDGKTRGFMTLIGGAIIAAVGALVPASISLGG